MRSSLSCQPREDQKPNYKDSETIIPMEVDVANQNKLSKPYFGSLPGEFALHYSQMIDSVNSLMGYNGEIVLNNHINLQGSRITGLGDPESPTDAIAHGVAESSYSASALVPKIQAGGSNSLATYRQLNSPVQREQRSSWLNDLMSTPPSANTIYPLITNGSGNATITIPATVFTFADESTVMLQSRTDVLSLPGSYSISSISATGNLVTLYTTTLTSLTAGQVMTIAGVSPTGFNGTFTVTFVNPSLMEIQYQDDFATGTGSGGSVNLNGCYYYLANKRSQLLELKGPFAGDAATNRLQACLDGSQIVAVVILTASGGIIAQSGGGGSPIVGSPAAGAFF